VVRSAHVAKLAASLLSSAVDCDCISQSALTDIVDCSLNSPANKLSSEDIFTFGC
jgi:hypothetical protein